MTQQFKALLLSLFVVFGFTACGETSPSSLAEKVAASAKKVTDLMGSVTDEASAEANKEGLTTATNSLTSMKGKFDALVSKLPAEQAGKIKSMLMEKLAPMMGPLGEQITRLKNNPKIAGLLQPVLDKLTNFVK